MAKKPQTEEKAKGLYDKVGNYSGKTLNLSRKQLGAAGRAAASVRGGKNVDISKTKYDATSKKVMGPAGKPLTGRVDLGGGNIGVYKNGVRVRAASGKIGTGGTGGGGTGNTAKSNAPTGKAANALARSNKATVAAQSGYTAGSKGNGYTKPTKPKNGFPSGGRAGNAFTRNSGADAWDMDKPYSAAQVGNAALIAASFLPVVGPAARGARAAIAARAAITAGKAAAKALPSAERAAIAGKSAAKAVMGRSTPRAIEAATTPKAITRGTSAQRAAATRSANQRAAAKAAADLAAKRQTAAAKAAATRKANREAAAAAAKGKGGKKK
jgi:hypothetical protein